MKPKLTKKQALFVEEYMKDLNASQAALRAGYSKKTAGRIGQQNLQKVVIQKEIQRLRNTVTLRNNVTIDKVLTEEHCIAHLDPAHLFDKSGKIKKIHEMPEAVRRAISAVKVKTKVLPNGDRFQTIEVKLWDKGRSLERLGKYLGMYDQQKADSGSFDVLVGNIHEMIVRKHPDPDADCKGKTDADSV